MTTSCSFIICFRRTCAPTSATTRTSRHLSSPSPAAAARRSSSSASMVHDRRIIFAASFLRAVANGLIGVLAGIYLAQLGLDPAAWGAVLGAGIAGTAVGAAGGMFWGDRIGRKRWLVGVGGVAPAGGGLLCFFSQNVVLGVPAVLRLL